MTVTGITTPSASKMRVMPIFLPIIPTDIGYLRFYIGGLQLTGDQFGFKAANTHHTKICKPAKGKLF
jgi:hypothetical protein